jgi:hypothetical protein
MYLRGLLAYNTDIVHNEGRSWQYAGEWAKDVDGFGSGDEGGACPLFLYRLHERVDFLQKRKRHTGFLRDHTVSSDHRGEPPPESDDIWFEFDELYDMKSVRAVVPSRALPLPLSAALRYEIALHLSEAHALALRAAGERQGARHQGAAD